GTYAVFAYTAGHAKIAEYLQIPFVPGAGELAVFCGALAAAGLGFLWFNAYPAQMFMGDVGSLALGSALGIVALITRQELVLVLVGGVFVGEALSVIGQVISFKLRRKRIFRMAPVHHHFELLGWTSRVTSSCSASAAPGRRWPPRSRRAACTCGRRTRARRRRSGSRVRRRASSCASARTGRSSWRASSSSCRARACRATRRCW